MGNTLVAAWIVSFLIALVGFIPYIIWLVRTALKKKWGRLGLQICAPLVSFILLLWITEIQESNFRDEHYRDIYDTEVSLGSPIFQNHSERSFHGDGYSISIYSLPLEIRVRFENADDKLMSNFPKRAQYRNLSSLIAWREAPANPEFDKHIDFALAEAGEYSAEIRQALSRQGTYYAFYPFRAGRASRNIDLFIVDLVGGRLYLIYSDT